MEQPTTLARIYCQLIQAHHHLEWYEREGQHMQTPPTQKITEYQQRATHCRTLIANLPTTNCRQYWRKALGWAKQRIPLLQPTVIDTVATQLKRARTGALHTFIPREDDPTPSLAPPICPPIETSLGPAVHTPTLEHGMPPLMEQEKETSSTSLDPRGPLPCLVNLHPLKDTYTHIRHVTPS